MKTIFTYLLSLFVSYAVNAQQSLTSSVSCTANTFYGLTSNDEIVSLTLNGATVTNNGIIVSNCNGLNSLAIANDLINGGNQNVFYSSGLDSVAYNDGTNWHSVLYDPLQYHNSGGARGYLYYQHNITPSQIRRFDGTTMTTIFVDSTSAFTVADIGVTDFGNVYFFTGTSPNTQFMNEISPSGVLIHTYTMSLNSVGAYGCFVMNNTVYIGIGPSGTNPYSLVPLTISGNTVSAGTPISMPPLNFKDLASCSGETTGIFSSPSLETNIIFYPNPTSDYLQFEIAGTTNCKLWLLDISGRVVLDQLVTNGEGIDVTKLPTGVYVAQITFKDKIIYKSVHKL